MIISPASQLFRKQFFTTVSDDDWNDWRWQLRHRIRDLEGIERLLHLSHDERGALEALGNRLPVGLTPYYASLLDRNNARAPIRRTKVPSTAEFKAVPGELDDPLGEDDHCPVPGIIHTYPDKVLFLVTDFCATYCRYCTRARMVGKGEFLPDRDMWEAGLDYIAGNKQIRDVLISGGDPLILGGERLGWLMSRLRKIPHVEILRIGTKVPVVLPQRITGKLVRMLKRFHPLYFSIHFIHPREITPEVTEACARLADAGIPLGGQMVLLRGINDSVPTMRDLVQGLLRIRVKPYYLHQCDAITGSSHFRTTIAAGQEIIRALHGFTTGYAVPTYMVDAPGGGGKVPIGPEYIVSRDERETTLRGYNGKLYKYPDIGSPAEGRPLRNKLEVDPLND